jgi:hypothetical protein
MIDQFIQFAESWVSKEMWVGLIMFSVIAFVGTLIAIPAILITVVCQPSSCDSNPRAPGQKSCGNYFSPSRNRHAILAGAGLTDDAFRDSLHRLSRQTSSGTKNDSASHSS